MLTFRIQSSASDCLGLWEGWFALSKEYQEECLYGQLLKDAQSEALTDRVKDDVLHCLATECPQRGIAEAYDNIRTNFATRAMPARLASKQRKLYQALDRESGGWLSEGKAVLDMCHRQEGVLNVILTASRLQASV